MINVNTAQIKKLLPFVSTDPRRQALAFIALQEGYLYATDGHKAARVSAESAWLNVADLAENTCFQVVKVGKELALEPSTVDAPVFPNMLAIWKKSGGKRWSLEAITGDKKNGQKLGSLLYRLALQGVCLNPINAQSLPEGVYQVSGPDRGKTSPIFFEADEFQALIMPMREDAERVEAVETEEKAPATVAA